MNTDTRFDPAGQSTKTHDLDDPSLYLNRELALLCYSRRVLHEAENDAVPLLERVRFFSDFGACLDHFFMHRVAGLKQQQGAGLSRPSIDGRTPEQQLAACRDHVQVYIADEAFVYFELCYLLAKEGIHILDGNSLTPEQSESMRRYYLERIRPLITPLAIHPQRQFPTISNLTNNLIIEAHEPASGRVVLIRIELPVARHMPRLIRLPGHDLFVPIEQIVAANLDDLLPGADIIHCGSFRVTHNAIVEGDATHAEDLLEALPAERRGHHYSRLTRLEISADLPAHLVRLLTSGLGIGSDTDIYTVNSLLGARDLKQIADLPLASLRYRKVPGSSHPRLAGQASILDDIAKNGPVLLQHPYHAYDRTVLPLLREAVSDNDVLAIKSTVSRDTHGSGLLPPLIMAARQGKHVVVVADSGKRCDRVTDEKWARYLEGTGIQVSFGPPGHTPRARAILIVRLEEDGSLSRTVHIASGDHDSSAVKPNADLGLISAEPDIGNDATELFNLLTSGLLGGRSFDALLVAPKELKTALIQRIQREQKAHELSGSGHIIIKANSLEDPDITRALYLAARAGVAIDLIIRADCRLRPGVRGLTENVRVVSVLGRFREHSRVYYFRNRGEEEYFVGSADPVSRPLSQNIEALVPVRGALRDELADLLRVQLDRRRGAWQMDANGDYRREYGGSDSDAQTQMLLRAQRAEARTKTA